MKRENKNTNKKVIEGWNWMSGWVKGLKAESLRGGMGLLQNKRKSVDGSWMADNGPVGSVGLLAM